jgi:hypothetical protein
MRFATRTVLLSLLSMTLLAGLSLSAVADQFIRYKGTTSAPSNNGVHVGVLKREGGRRLEYIAFHATMTCEDSSTYKRKLLVRHRRLDDDGAFFAQVPKVVKRTYLRVEGSIAWGKGSGTVVFNEAKLTDDGLGPQLCTTGELEWTVERGGAVPVRHFDM